VLYLLSHARLRVQRHPAFPTPSFFEVSGLHNSDASRRENAELRATVIARLDRAIQYSRDADDRIEKPRRIGYPACAGYDD
jgi:hypothetical protein